MFSSGGWGDMKKTITRMFFTGTRHLDICESEELADMKEAKALKAAIYTHVLDRWYWFEGQQIIQNRRWKRKDFQKKLDDLTRELKETEKL